jgi:glycosyltransferase involved in cell wall biosynthesis
MSRRKPAGRRKSPVGHSGAIYPLSLCMIVRDEERFLRDALTSVEGVVDEICIVDTGSTDGTVAIAESFGANINVVTWRDDFAWARNQALALATGAWIFVLDADERLAPESRELLRALRGVKPDGRGRWIRCRNYNDAELKTIASTNAIVRIFPNDPAIRYRGTLHEYIARTSVDGPLPAERTPIEIVHHGYTHDVMSSRLKAERNLRVSRAAFEAAPGDPVFVYNYAMSALLAGESEIAREQLERVISLTAGTPRGFRPMALSKLAGLYVDAARPADALRVADECIAIVGSYPDGHFARGRALIGLRRYDEARASFEESIRAGSSTAFEHFVVDDEIASWKAHNEIGGTFVIERRFAEARQRLELALKGRPKERTLLLNVARCCEAQGDLSAALENFRAVLDTFHDEAGAIEYVNYVFRHESADGVLAAVEAALPVLGDDYRRAFLTSAAAAMLRVQRRDETVALLQRVLAVGDELAGRAVIQALAQHYKQPELNDVLAGVVRAG